MIGSFLFATVLVSTSTLVLCGYGGTGDNGGSFSINHSQRYPSSSGGSSSGWGGWMRPSQPKPPIHRFYSFDPNRSQKMEGWGTGTWSSVSSPSYGSKYPASSQWSGSPASGSYNNDIGWGSNIRQPPPRPRPNPWQMNSPGFPPPKPMGHDNGWGSSNPPQSRPSGWSSTYRPPPQMQSGWGHMQGQDSSSGWKGGYASGGSYYR